MSSNIKKSKTAVSTVIIALIIILIASAAVGGVTLILVQKAPVASPNPSTVPAPTQSSPQSLNTNVAKATSLQFTITFTNSTGTELNRYVLQGKNLGNANLMTRIDWTYRDANGNPHELITIDNRIQQKSWTSTNSAGAPTWVLVPADEYAKSQTSENFAWQSNVYYLENYWNGVTDVSVFANGSTIRIFNISVNPVLPDSLFQP
jgi:hypothetical protein